MKFTLLAFLTGAFLFTAGWAARAQSIPGIPLRQVPTLYHPDSAKIIRLQSIAGVSIQAASAPQPRDPAKVRLGGCRGGNSNQPLFVVDGLVFSTMTQSDLNPNDIEKINVLKGADATALYGSRAQYGVIQITTKRPAKPQPQRAAEWDVLAR